ncbi:hypothetical protein F3Y22_tig00111812pilonHSYRG00018 [Hibiscus syriacus]|uniref:VQ domain-containing protein n=1 Tax=Hibiscus syriacus TaxID=106335 RepID=A0A6A2XZT7_HIBSY|nr:hypothetical protein F3Y22_tig00111812pilonHSYRG00018 [Hibiscus syriacus]
MFGDQSYDSTVVTATVKPSAVGSVPACSSGGRLSLEGGRVGKPARKRSRASRRTPTTLLNTDTTNFRAMVQQFTGNPSLAPGSAHPVDRLLGSVLEDVNSILTTVPSWFLRLDSNCKINNS